ncbi:4Fe-4S dicluster domain-containing protein [Aliarcobacter thereius]|uniref:Formate hydrogenlyase complex iron-sulfur subunit n=2 Tax=Aliarcobacter thereius TaxID=544718 RepID=A0A1C0B7A4_9BACT|nr:4Fe-4S dicluster domain-containing protein [Aliarcobacter thereius]OCL91029.1 formate hydrogenlyase complex iron-sulfur subunit [Aliarcobacter thereius]OCL96136.1 formate hydrogenlyase complex iron-sulfur subunit [Aliarcobacter thereius LMG 24486]OCL99470.1 formate hydrogenlyase complex iron-sulfur subunit [Aliarcobacter thereius]QBF15894.1 [Fe-S] cluster domain-containing protein [Aliarcobacter thereius LMG 24486]TLS94759.1 4Fe-4S dicluster domain-containing protein [Aliarcobacter thereius
MQEYIYFNKAGLDFPLSEKIQVATTLEELKDNNFLISNTNEVKSEAIANEIDFYIKNSKDNLSSKIENVLKLYEINATKFDFAQDLDQSINISNSLMIVYDNLEDFKDFTKDINANEFDLYKVESKLIKKIKNSVGNFDVIVDAGDKDIVLKVSQIVWFDEKLDKKRAGIYDPNISSIEETLKTIRKNLNGYNFRKTILYDKSICQYHERKDEICSKCVEVCPTNTITKDEDNRRLVFDLVNCITCGECVSACPSGSLNSGAFTKDSLYELSSFYKNTKPLIISSKSDIKNLNIDIKEGVLPLCIVGDIFDESVFLTYLQISSSQIVYFSNDISKGTKESIEIVNDIYMKKYGKLAVYLVSNEKELKEALEKQEFIENSYYNFNQSGMRKREIFSQRLQKLVANDDLGIVKTGENIHYGRVLVNESNCTLCLSCVGACNVDALFANEADFSLRINPSLCTACGYCEIVCPENDCLTIKQDEIELNPNWFKETILAQDKLFACLECGKEFATTKAIEKIALMMEPIFKTQSAAKVRSLYCCADCKPKIMIKEEMSKNAKY